MWVVSFEFFVSGKYRGAVERFERFIVSRMVSHAISCYKSRPLSYNVVYFSSKNVSYTHLVEEKRNLI